MSPPLETKAASQQTPACAAHPHADWAVAVVASRENLATLDRTLAALARAAVRPAVVDLLVNGNAALAAAAASHFGARRPGAGALQLRVWSIAYGDKANAINQYLHAAWPGAHTTFFVDGYVQVRADALDRLAHALSQHGQAMAAAAVPTVGRSAAWLAEDMRRHGGLHGNLFALRRELVEQLRASGFRLPLGLYRTDSTLGAVIALDQSGGAKRWRPTSRIVVDSSATWDVDQPAWWRMSAWRGHLKRRLRQAQGDLENRAVRHWLMTLRRQPESLQPSARQLVSHWMALDPAGAAGCLRGHPMRQLALRQLHATRDLPVADQLAHMLVEA